MAVFNYNNKYKVNMGVGGTSATPATLTDIELDFGTDWMGITYSTASGNWLRSNNEVSGAIPRQLRIHGSFSIPNTSSSPVVYNNLYMDAEYNCSWVSTWKSLGSVSLDSVTIPADDTATVSGTCINQASLTTDGACAIAEFVYSTHNTQHPAYNTLPNNATISVRLTLRNGSTKLGYGTQSDTTFSFTLPAIYDYRSFNEHWVGRYTELEPKTTSITGLSPTTATGTSTVIQYENDYSLGSTHSVGPNMHLYMPEFKIETTSGDTLFDNSCCDFATKAETTKKPGVIKNSATIADLCNYFRENDLTSSTIITWRSYIRNPYKRGELALGSLILMDGGYCYTVTSNDGTGYYDSDWYYFDASQHIYTASPASSVNTLSISYSSSIGYVLQNPVVLGCYYTQYTFPIVTIRYTVGWGVKKITITPKEGLLNVQTVTVDVPLPNTTTTTGTVTLTQPAAYPDSFVGDRESVDTNIGVSVSTSNGGSKNTDNTITVYKFINLEITDTDGYRCTSTGVKDINGDYIKLIASWRGSRMGGYNPITTHITVTKLIDGEVLYDSDTTSATASPWSWVSSNTYIDDEVSYKITVTFKDRFRTRIDAVNIGTKVAYIEWGDEPGHIAIGKYVETNGLEIQFPTLFHKTVVFLTRGSNHMGEAAAHVPYTDTYNIGASNVQEALNWIFGRLS